MPSIGTTGTKEDNDSFRFFSAAGVRNNMTISCAKGWGSDIVLAPERRYMLPSIRRWKQKEARCLWNHKSASSSTPPLPITEAFLTARGHADLQHPPKEHIVFFPFPLPPLASALEHSTNTQEIISYVYAQNAQFVQLVLAILVKIGCRLFLSHTSSSSTGSIRMRYF